MAERTREPGQWISTDTGVARLALCPKDAAKALGIGERLLWSKTKSDEIPCARIGRRVVYPVEGLRAYLARASRRSGR